ncbi:unnamed protein product [Schistocephalus solidus]|uniref:Cytochrome c oxidase assembly protein COX15 homolog n=1 Tax=Schistocephalus solidus TaxID=70667 RepID=A0A183TNW0_SCHSO|nr:unnamed protein product [Schistocephalus solidus]
MEACRATCGSCGLKPLLRTTLRFKPRNLSTDTDRIAEGLNERSRTVVGAWLGVLTGMTFGAVILGGVTRYAFPFLPYLLVLLSQACQWLIGTCSRRFPHAPRRIGLQNLKNTRSFPNTSSKGDYSSLLCLSVVREHGEMTLSRFKFIWHMEYGHRQWGRLLGLVYALPAGYFWYKGYFTKRMKPRGLLGWYMVKSGLKKPQPPVGVSPNEDFVGVPRVSHLRLAAHLSTATILYSLFLWASFSHFVKHQKIPKFDGLLRLKILTHSSKALVFTTLVWGAFVAGLDAGWIYNSWPKMADRWVPEDLIVPRYGSTGRNLIDNPTAVQFMHRMLAYTSVGCICTLWGLTMVAGRGRTGPRIRNAAHLMLAAVFGQSALGILTLINYVPVSLGAMHQSGSLILFSTLLWFSHCLRAVPKV